MRAPSPFATSAKLDAWLAAKHQCERELWVRIFKKGSGTLSVAWHDCVVAAIAWGWIDSQRKSLDGISFLQRLTPRRPNSEWSMRNREHAERLIAAGLMRPQGLVQVEAARADGRWAQAYVGSADMVLPEDLITAVEKKRAAKRVFETLDRRSLYAIYRLVQTARREDTRQRRVADILARLTRGEAFTPVRVRRR